MSVDNFQFMTDHFHPKKKKEKNMGGCGGGGTGEYTLVATVMYMLGNKTLIISLQ